MRTILRALYFRHALAKEEMNTQLREAIAKAFRDFGVEKRQEAIAAIHQRHIHAKRGEDRGILATDHAAADHGEASRNRLHFQDRV